MNEMNKLLYGVYNPDERLQALYNRLSLYYRQTPDSMDNHTAIRHRREFKQWCNDFGYTQDEINRAKRNVRI